MAEQMIMEHFVKESLCWSSQDQVYQNFCRNWSTRSLRVARSISLLSQMM